MSKTHKYTNGLINETSPYLLQHAHNPVNWKPWNKETLELAKKENKLILISVGYAACHWCHVMEHESFENDSVATIMNKHFINIKVDREERPDIDQVYMEAVQIMTGQGGWPLNCIALPDGRPIYGGTYFPKEQWKSLLTQLADIYEEKPEEAIKYADQLENGLKQAALVNYNSNEPNFNVDQLKNTVLVWQEGMDKILGGSLGTQNKFPMPNNYDFLLRYGKQMNDQEVLAYTNTTLIQIAYGGIYDHVGGGFSRYSVDKKWHVPHFEKMLYDNGQLVSLYADTFLATKNLLYKEVVEETLTFVERELMHESGAFYSSLDADSLDENGKLVEGAFYVWTEDQLQKLIGDDFAIFKDYYNINYYGFWEHDNYVLIRKESDKTIAKNHKITLVSLKNKVDQWKATLLKERAKRERPRLDDKTLTSWNALMLKGYIDAYRVFNNPHYLEIALKNAHFLKDNQLRKDGGLNHNYKNNVSNINGYLEDYATLINAYISLYEVTLDEQWLEISKRLTDYTFEHFYDTKSGLFFFTSNEDDSLITRKIDVNDNVIPASNSIMARNLAKLSHYYSNKKYLKTSQQMLNNVVNDIINYPAGYSNWLQLLADFSGNYYEIAISGKNATDKLKKINSYYIPNKLIAGSISKSSIPLMEGRSNIDKTLIYICVDGACKLPHETVSNAMNEINISLE